MEYDPGLRFDEVPESRLDEALDLAYLAFHEKREEERYRHQRRLLLGCERVGAYDGDALVGLAAAFRFDLSVPGGDLPCAGVSFVCVAPTHRRRGALSGMLGELHRRSAENGRAVSALWASEDVIYGRFGYGTATRGTTIEIDSRTPLRLRIDPDEGPLRLVDPAEAPALIGPYYERTRAERPGRIARTEAWWREEWLPEKDPDEEEAGPPRVVVLGEPITGYALYRVKDLGEDRRPEVRLDDLEADTPAGAAALWRYLASIDLTDKVRAWNRPADDPLLLFAADRDRVRVTATAPELRLRLLDPGAALRARSWAAPVDLVLDVRDGHLPGNAGRHRLAASPDGCSYTPAEGPADLALDVRDLASCYLGDTRAADLLRAGLLTEHTPGAAAALDAALRTESLPHTADDF
ncbi:GNAT family N-acetyltransferase [Nocardiopsis potens]|uniref:GNAT family N-acetyltransferase n=1 Tax=Nocardiopsis potens TaxID=1246458 RepID=UPI00034D2A6B|nr:GNAT family N-acetyltransferase [Nocardiopsis potens]